MNRKLFITFLKDKIFKTYFIYHITSWHKNINKRLFNKYITEVLEYLTSIIISIKGLCTVLI